MSPGTARSRLEPQAFHFARARSPDLGVHPACWPSPNGTWCPGCQPRGWSSSAMLRAGCLMGLGSNACPLSLGVPPFCRGRPSSPPWPAYLPMGARGPPSLGVGAAETTEPGSGAQDKTQALSTMADEPGGQGPSKEGIPAEMGPRGAQDRPLGPS